MTSTHDEHVPHEPQIDEAINDQLSRLSNQTAIDDMDDVPVHDSLQGVGTAGGTYSQSEANEAVAAVNALTNAFSSLESTVSILIASHNSILTVLRDSGLIPSE